MDFFETKPSVAPKQFVNTLDWKTFGFLIKRLKVRCPLPLLILFVHGKNGMHGKNVLFLYVCPVQKKVFVEAEMARHRLKKNWIFHFETTLQATRDRRSRDQILDTRPRPQRFETRDQDHT